MVIEPQSQIWRLNRCNRLHFEDGIFIIGFETYQRGALSRRKYDHIYIPVTIAVTQHVTDCVGGSVIAVDQTKQD